MVSIHPICFIWSMSSLFSGRAAPRLRMTVAAHYVGWARVTGMTRPHSRVTVQASTPFLSCLALRWYAICCTSAITWSAGAFSVMLRYICGRLALSMRCPP